MRASRKQDITLWTQIAFGIILLFLLFRPDNQIIKTSKPKTIVNNIHQKEEHYREIEKSIIPDNAQIQRLNGTVADLMEQVLYLKEHRDTAMLIETQDTLIGTLYHQGQIKDTVISKQGLVIADLKYISSSKDTLLLIKDARIKKVVRQRNIFMIISGLMTGVAIIK